MRIDLNNIDTLAESLSKWMDVLGCTDDIVAPSFKGSISEGLTRVVNENVEADLEEIVRELNQKLKVGKVAIKRRGVTTESTDSDSDNNVDDFFDSVNGDSPNKPLSKIIGKPKYQLSSQGHKTEATRTNDCMMEYILYLRPSDYACPGAGNCAKGCLVVTGNMAQKAAKDSRASKTELLKNQREAFMAALCSDIQQFRDYSKHLVEIGYIQDYFVRLNGTSDFSLQDIFIIRSAAQTIMERFPDVQFVDYTKVFKGGRGTQAALKDPSINGSVGSPNRMRALSRVNVGNYDTYLSRKYPNYYAVYSYDGESHTSNRMDCEQILEMGECITVIFDDYNHRLPLPKTFPFGGKTYRVVPGDYSDARHYDRRKYNIPDGEGFIVGLTHKRPWAAKLGYNITDGKNTNTQSIDLAAYYGVDCQGIWNKKYDPLWCQKHLWPYLRKQGFDFYGRRFTPGQPTPKYNFDPQSKNWVYQDVEDVEYPVKPNSSISSLLDI